MVVGQVDHSIDLSPDFDTAWATHTTDI